MDADLTLVTELLVTTEKLNHAMTKYHGKRRDYGTDEFLYMRETHFLMNLGDATTPLSMGEIAELMDISYGAVSQLAERLEKKGYLVRQKSEADNRSVLCLLTEKGIHACEVHTEYDIQTFRIIKSKFADFTEEELNTYLEVAKILTNCYLE